LLMYSNDVLPPDEAQYPGAVTTGPR